MYVSNVLQVQLIANLPT